MESDGYCYLTFWKTHMERTPEGICRPEFWAEAARKSKLAESRKGQRLPGALELELARAREEMVKV